MSKATQELDQRFEAWSEEWDSANLTARPPWSSVEYDQNKRI